jgi:hypothetical protein
VQKRRALDALYLNYGKNYQAARYKIAAEEIFNPDQATREMQDAYETIYLNVLNENGDLIQPQLGGNFALDDPATREYLKAAGVKIQDISLHTLRQLRKQLTAGQEAGESVDELAGRIKNLPGFGAARARVVARTELGHASNTSALALYQESGLVESIRVYDGETHPPCAAVNGKVLTLQEAKSFPTLGHPNCVRAFGAIPTAGFVEPAKQPEYPPEYENIMGTIGAGSGGRFPLQNMTKALTDHFGKDVNSILFDDSDAVSKNFAGIFRSGSREIGLAPNVTAALKKIQETGKIETFDEFDAIRVVVHECEHSLSPMYRDISWASDPTKYKGMYNFLEEGIVETRARHKAAEFINAVNMADAKDVEEWRKKGAYPQEVDVIKNLSERSSRSDIVDKIFNEPEPNRRRNIASKEAAVYIRQKAREVYKEEFDKNEALSSSHVEDALFEVGDSAWGIMINSWHTEVFFKEHLYLAMKRLKDCSGYY